jgi:hypothetical protein
MSDNYNNGAKMFPRLSPKALLTLAFIILVTVGQIGLLQSESKKTYNLYLNISDSTAAHVSGDDVFITIEPGKHIEGNVPISNNDTVPNHLRLSLSGALADTGWVGLKPSDELSLSAKETRHIGITIDVPPSASGNFFGKLTVTGKRN